MKVIIGADEAAFELKMKIIKHLECIDVDVHDIGVYNTNPSLYPDTAKKLSDEIVRGNYDRGILLCGTGIGMAITANKVPGIRAAVAHDIFSLERMILSNDCQILCMGARIIAYESARLLINRWLELEFIESPSSEKINRIIEIEKSYQ